jgi:hypothetical protein
MTDVLIDFAERFLEVDPVILQPEDEVRERFGSLIDRIVLPEDLQVRHLENVVDFLYEHGTAAADIEKLFSSGGGGILGLARDVAILERYLDKGMIIDVRVIEE